MHILGTCGHSHAKQEVSMSHPVVRRGSAQTTPLTTPTTVPMMTTQDGQSMIVQGPSVDKPNEPQKE